MTAELKKWASSLSACGQDQTFARLFYLELIHGSLRHWPHSEG